MKATLLCAIPALLALTACSNIPSNSRLEGAESVSVGTDNPGSGYEEIRTYYGYGKGCETPVTEDSAREHALNSVINRAYEAGADYVQLLGAGPKEDRGSCARDVFRISGTGYRRADTQESRNPSTDSTSSNSPEPAARSTADKLEELDSLRERGLVSPEEYQRLRAEILDDAF